MALYHSPQISTSGLVFYVDALNLKSYPGSGASWTDLVGGRIMTLNNGPTYSNGSLTFDGTNQFANVSTTGLNTGTNLPFSLEMWVNFTAYNTGNRQWLSVLGPANTGGNHWLVTNATNNTFGIYGVAQGQFSMSLSPISTWQHLVQTFDGTNNRGYVNGVLLGGPTSVTAYNFSSTPLTLGTPGALAEKYYSGQISIVRIYNRSLSSDEILINFNSLRGRYGI